MYLQDDNIILRPLRLDDASRLALLANNKKIADNLRDRFPHPYTLQDAKDFLAMNLPLKPVQLFAIEYNGVHVGNVGVHPMDDVYRKSAEIGYFLGEEYWNKGIMSRAVKLAIDYAFAELDVVRIFTGIFDFNTASGRVLEKCGFKKEAVFEKAVFKNGNFYDEIRYAIIKNSK